MQKDVIQIALASLVSEVGSIQGWETGIVSGLGKLPDDYYSIIKAASKLSSGGIGSTHSTEYLESIYNNISLNDKTPNTGEPKFYSPRSLSLQKDVLFPDTLHIQASKNANSPTLRDELLKALPSEFEENESYLEGVLTALYRCAINIPSSSQTDVSLYDQLRMTAALAVCLLEKNSGDIKQVLDAVNGGAKKDGTDEPIALLVGGDISGIQDFIYTITAKGAAKSLRGRSFYLQLLTEAILRFVLRRLEIPYTNVIYSGGGHFFLLAPVSKAKVLLDIQKDITLALLKHHRTSLYLALGSAEVPASGFFDGKFPEYWGEMHRALALRKQKRYSELEADLYMKVFVPREFGGNPDETCSVCKEDHRKTRKWDDLDIQERICTLCDSFIEEIGKKLPRSSFIALGFDSAQSAKVRNASDALSEFGMSFQFLEDSQDKVEINADQTVLWALDDPKNGQWPASKGVPKWLRYTANRVPLDSFDELQQKVQGGFERLGVLRMDVDNLGDLFKRGLGKKATLPQLASRDHSHLCPRQILGVRIELAGMFTFGFAEPPTHKELLVISETDGCFVDGVIAATGCAVGHRTLRVEDYGKVAATFVDTKTGRAVRVAPRMDIRELACSYIQDESRHYFAQMRSYQIMPDEKMFTFTPVTLTTPIEAIISRPGLRVNCDVCGEEIMNEREVCQSGLILCPSCAHGGYYQIVSGNKLRELSEAIHQQVQMIC